MKVISIGSGSKGNSTLIQIAGVYVLVDNGFTLKETERRLPLSPREICAVLLTHDHSDHLCGVCDLARKYGIEVHMPDRLIHLRNTALKGASTLTHVDGEYNLGGIKVSQFRLPHDATYTVGYKLEGGGESFSIVTDVGQMREGVLKNILGTNFVMLESNYDTSMLDLGPYPPQLKKRIKGGLGHISNDIAGDTAVKLVESGTKTIVLSHISENNNIPELAYDTVGKNLDAKGLKSALYFAEQNKIKFFDSVTIND